MLNQTMKILITGGGGFLGYNLTRFLAKQESTPTLIVYNRQHGNDILNQERLSTAIKSVDLIIHLASLTDTSAGEDKKDTYESVNVQGTKFVIELAAKANVPVIYPSTCDLYDGSDTPIIETAKLNPKPTVYAQSKFRAEQICLKAIDYGQNIAILRLFNPYGINQSPKKLIPSLLRNAKFDQPLLVYGDGATELDYVFSEDVASAIWAARDLEAGTVVNVATGSGVTATEIAELVAVRYGGFVVHVNAPQFVPRRLVGSSNRLTELTGWKPAFDLEKGLAKTRDWYQRNQPFEPLGVTHAG